MSTQIKRDEPTQLHGIERILGEVLALEREIVEFQYVRRADALERVGEAVRRLGEVGSPRGILDRAAEELGTSSQFDRVLISEVLNSSIHPRAIWARDDQSAADAALIELGRAPIRLEYPLIEQEVALAPRVVVVSVARSRSRASARLTEILGWDSYVLAALTIRGNTLGLLHADTICDGRPLDALDAEVAARYVEGLAGAFERAALREMLRLHRQELQSAVRWMSGRVGELTRGSVELGPHAAVSEPRAVDSLTPRELDVLRLLARGKTNLAIAKALVIREGTVKYHVKNILRKLGATSRADAVARYVRSTGPG